MQYQANSLIKQVNQFIDGSSADPIDKVGGAGADDEVYVQGPTTTTTMSFPTLSNSTYRDAQSPS